MNGIPNPRGEKQITSGKVEGRGRDGERDRERWREKGRPLKRCAHKATKHLGTCRARQVETETKLLLSSPAGGWLGVKDLNVVPFTSKLSNILIGPCNPSNGKMKRLDLHRMSCFLGLHDDSMWEARMRPYVTCQEDFELRSKFAPHLRDAGLTETREASRDVQGGSDHSTSSQKSKRDV